MTAFPCPTTVTVLTTSDTASFIIGFMFGCALIQLAHKGGKLSGIFFGLITLGMLITWGSMLR